MKDNETTTPITDQDIKTAKEAYINTLIELQELETEKKKIIRQYIQELEQQKIQKLRSSI